MRHLFLFPRDFPRRDSGLAQDGTRLGENGSWLATLNFDDLVIDKWDVDTVDEVAAAAGRKLRVWATAVEIQLSSPTDRHERLQWEKKLAKKDEVAGAKTLKSIETGSSAS